jgi:hypothetical protein
VFLAKNVLGSDEDVKAISANESDDDHVDKSVEPAGVVEGFVHSEDSGSKTSFQQMCEGFRVSVRGVGVLIP